MAPLELFLFDCIEIKDQSRGFPIGTSLFRASGSFIIKRMSLVLLECTRCVRNSVFKESTGLSRYINEKNDTICPINWNCKNSISIVINIHFMGR